MKTANYTQGPIGDVEVLPDFLPLPRELAFKEDNIKVTLSLSSATINFFKEQAAQHQAKYQRMIRTLLDAYVAQHAGAV